MHYVVALRQPFQGRIILMISKCDYSNAYRLIAHSASAAVQTITIHGLLAYLLLRLTFSGSPNPPTWCVLSEIVKDPRTLHSQAQPVAPLPR